MDAVHVFLSNEMISTKVILLKDMLVAVISFVASYAGIAWLRSLSLPSESDKHPPRSKKSEFTTRQSLVHAADVLSAVISNLAHTEYGLKDNQQYPLVSQTPLRDNLQTLRELTCELRHNANYSPSSATLSCLPKSVSKSTYPIVCSEQVVQDIYPAIKDYAQRQSINIELFENAHGYLSISLGMTEKILRELLLNAIVHNPKHTRIQFTCSFNEHFAIFEVQDNGVGLNAEVTHHAFGLKVSSEGLRSRRLSDAEMQINLKNIGPLVKNIGGDIEIRSALAWGTHIRLLIPVCKKAPRSRNKKHQTLTHRQQPVLNQRKKVLLISKQAFINNAVNECLVDQYAVHAYSSFDQALMALWQVEPDIVIADFSWHYALGIQFCQFLRGSSYMSEIPFVMLTMAIDQTTRVNMYAKGVSAIVEKPLDIEELKIVVNNFSRSKAAVENEIKEAQVNYVVKTISGEVNSQHPEFASALTLVVEQHFYDESFTRFCAADLMHISEKTLQRRMAKYFGMTFGQYLRKVRLEQARLKLLEGQLITQVSFDVGFNSTSYFGQCFKYEFGYSPSMLSKAAG